MIFIIQLLMILVLLILIYILFRQKRILNLAKRFEPYSLISTSNKYSSLFDLINIYIWKLIHVTTKMISKSAVLKDYSLRYEKHIKYEDRDNILPMDYISIKFLLGFTVVGLSIVSATFQLGKFTIMNFLISFLIGFFIPDIIIEIQYSRRRKKIEEELLEAIIMMNNSFKSGRNIMQSVEIVANELDGPIADEFKKINMDMTYGLSLETVFQRFYNRVQLEDAMYITNSLTLLNKTGGNIVKVFNTIEKNFFEKKKLKTEMHSLTSASIFVYRVLCILPFIFIFVIYILNPTYFEPMFKTTLGRLILLFIVLFYTLYILVIRKVLEVKM